MARLLLLGNLLRDRNEDVHGQQTHAILIITGQILEEGYHFINHNLRLHLLDKLGEVVGGLSSDHRSFIVYQCPKVLSEALLDRRRGFAVWCRVQAGRRDLGGEPIGFGKV